MRLFISFEVSEEVKQHLLELQKKLSFAKLAPARHFHLTLKFLGDVNEEKLQIIKQKLSQIKFKPFTAKLSKIGVFPSEDYVRVVWVGLEPEETINSLQKQIEDSLSDLFEKDPTFKPHLTLARVKMIDDKDKFRENLKKINVKALSFKVDSFKLVKSVLGGKLGSEYEDVLEIKSQPDSLRS